MERVSGSRPRLPTTITLFTEAMSDLPCHQFPYATLIPLSGDYLDARNALLRQHLYFAHPAHSRQRFPQPFGIDPGRYRQRQTRNLVDLAAHRSHPGGEREPDRRERRAHCEHAVRAMAGRGPAPAPAARGAKPPRRSCVVFPRPGGPRAPGAGAARDTSDGSMASSTLNATKNPSMTTARAATERCTNISASSTANSNQ